MSSAPPFGWNRAPRIEAASLFALFGVALFLLAVAGCKPSQPNAGPPTPVAGPTAAPLTPEEDREQRIETAVKLIQMGVDPTRAIAAAKSSAPDSPAMRELQIELQVIVAHPELQKLGRAERREMIRQILAGDPGKPPASAGAGPPHAPGAPAH